MPYDFLDHSTDAIVLVRHHTMRGALGDAARATTDIMLDRSAVCPLQTRHFAITETAVHRLLYQWLDDIIFAVLADGFAIHDVEVDGFGEGDGAWMRARAFGEPLDTDKHRFRVEVKAPTYHEMDITQSGGVRLRFLLDL